MLWLRPATAEATLSPNERRVRDYLDTRAGVSESARSLAAKLGLRPRVCRGILDRLAEEGIVRRRDFSDMEPLYVRFPER